MSTFHFTNFKSFEDAELGLSEPFTLLIGKNGSGKSNAIEGVELLAQLAQGRPLHEISDVGRDAAFEVRGGLAGCVRRKKDGFALEYVGRHTYQGSLAEVRYRIEVAALGAPRVVSESFTFGAAGGKPLFTRRAERGEGAFYDRSGERSGPDTLLTSLPTDRSLLSQYESHGTGYGYSKDLAALALAVRSHVVSSFVLDPQPKRMRLYEPIGNRTLTRDGANLSAVLYALEQGTADDREALKRILGWIRNLPEEPYKSFGFVTTELNDVLFGVNEASNGQIMDARLLSDGTLRCIAILTALETVESGSRVVIEEFDNGVSPSRVGILTGAIQDCSSRRKLHVLCTTHNPATLDALTPEQLRGVVVCHVDKESGASKLVRLLDIPRADVMLQRGQLGDLVTRRVLETHLLPNYEAEQQREIKKWLESLP